MATRAGIGAWRSPAAATAAGKSWTTTENPSVKHMHVDEDPSTVDLLPKKQSTMHNGATAIHKTTFKTETGRRILWRDSPTTVDLTSNPHALYISF
jgi:hypothetical protein